MSGTLDALHNLSPAALRELAASLSGGYAAAGLTLRAAQQIAGAAQAAALAECAGRLAAEGWTPAQMGALAKAVADAKERAPGPDNLFSLVLSGPDVSGAPTRDTAAVMSGLIEEARVEVLAVGYAIHNGKRLFERLAQRMTEAPGLKVWFCLDIQRRPGDTSLSSEIVRRFGHDFRAKQWPWEPKPEVYYDPRSLEAEGAERSSLHAKCVVVDRKAALITSANFTEAAQERNIEAGVVVRHPPTAERLAGYFEGLRGVLLRRCEM